MTGKHDTVVTADMVRERLRDVVDPCSAATGSNLDMVEMGLVKSIAVDDEHVDIVMRLTTPMCHMIPYFKKEVEGHVGDLDGVHSVDLSTDDGTEWTESHMSAEATRKRQIVLDHQRAKYEREMKADGGESGET